MADFAEIVDTESIKESREQYAKLQHELRQLNQTYDDIFSSVIQSPSTEYLRCKNHFIFRRKHEIKRMIKGCLVDSVMLKFPEQPKFESDDEETQPQRGLLAAVTKYSEETKEVNIIESKQVFTLLAAMGQYNEERKKARIFAEIQSEVEHLNAEGLQIQIRITKSELLEIKTKFGIMYQELIKLKEGYEASNQMVIPFRRYSARKRMLKSYITRNSYGSIDTSVPLSRVGKYTTFKSVAA